MKLRELIEALQKAPPEALDQDVLMFWEHGRGCQGLHLVECVRFRSGDVIEPFQVILAHFDLLQEPKLHPESDRRKYLSDVSWFVS